MSRVRVRNVSIPLDGFSTGEGQSVAAIVQQRRNRKTAEA